VIIKKKLLNQIEPVRSQYVRNILVVCSSQQVAFSKLIHEVVNQLFLLWFAVHRKLGEIRKVSATWHCFLIRRSTDVEEQLHGLSLRLCLEKHLPSHKFGEDTSDRPHVYPKVIVLVTQQKLRRSIPKCHNPCGVRIRLVVRMHNPCKTKVGNLHQTISREQYVGTLQVPVRDMHPVMKVDESVKQLLHNALDLWQSELDLLVRHARQIKAQIIEEQEVAASILVLVVRCAA
jgi:hypothetical protein